MRGCGPDGWPWIERTIKLVVTVCLIPTHVHCTAPHSVFEFRDADVLVLRLPSRELSHHSAHAAGNSWKTTTIILLADMFE